MFVLRIGNLKIHVGAPASVWDRASLFPDYGCSLTVFACNLSELQVCVQVI